MKISVAMCTYNGERYIAEQMESIARQTRVPDEIIICDDVSTDGTIAIIKSFDEFAKAMSFQVNIRHLGVTKNFETAIKLCSNEIIVLCDQDDVWMGNKLAMIEQTFLAQPNINLIFSDGVVVDSALRPMGYTLWNHVKYDAGRDLNLWEELLRRNIMTGATMAFRASIKSAILPIPQEWVHDAWISLIAVALGNVYPEKTALVRYRNHGGNMIGADTKGISDKLKAGKQFSYEQYYQVAERYKELQERLIEIKSDKAESKRVVEIQQKMLHFKTRGLIHSRARFDRLSLIAVELLNHRYAKYSNGVLSAAKDLLV